MSPPAILITQCLQNDFVRPVSQYDPLPNALHIGYAESRRLLGRNPEESPLARLLEWAYAQSSEGLRMLHIRDWHDAADAQQYDHLQRFGEHCLAGTAGADFVFTMPQDVGNEALIVDSLTLNDFQNTNLEAFLAPYANMEAHIGIAGVWTEAKVLFLAYELRSRYPKWRIAVCSALTASSSRQRHFLALEQMRRILGVTICPSIGDFMEFLGGSARAYPLTGMHEDAPTITFDKTLNLPTTDMALLRYLFRNCKSLQARVLDGGFSGNVVLGVKSVDCQGHEQTPYVVKIGPRSPIGQERTAFERIEDVLGNVAPRISDFADLEDRGALKYRYASMGPDNATTFQKKYMNGLPLKRVESILRTVFDEQLGKLYAAATLETLNLFEYYDFSSRWAGSVQRKVEALLGGGATDEWLTLPGGAEVYNVCAFYETEVDHYIGLHRDMAYMAYIHGDLNGANIVLDSRENVWLIDFFHTHRGHVLRDLIKLENDILYIFTPIADEATLKQAYALTDWLLCIVDLAAVPDMPMGIDDPLLLRGAETVRILRRFYAALIDADRAALQWRIAALRYAVHTLSFDESSHNQKLWALYTAGRCADAIRQEMQSQGTLRIDWLDESLTDPGGIGLTICPGRKDTGRDLPTDLRVLRREGVDAVLCLLPEADLRAYGVADLLDQYRAANFKVYHLPVLDQRAPSLAEMQGACDWLLEKTAAGRRVLIHCIGGLGRSGLAAGCYLRAKGMPGEDAIRAVRRARSERAIETQLQEHFVNTFTLNGGQE